MCSSQCICQGVSSSDKSEYLLCLLPESFPPLDQLKTKLRGHMHISRGSVFLSLSDLQVPHLHCLQWRVWSPIRSCHVMAWLCFCYHFARQNVHSFPSNVLSNTSVVLDTRLISGAQRQPGSFNHKENIFCLHRLRALVLVLFYFHF